MRRADESEGGGTREERAPPRPDDRGAPTKRCAGGRAKRCEAAPASVAAARKPGEVRRFFDDCALACSEVCGERERFNAWPPHDRARVRACRESRRDALSERIVRLA